MQRRGHDKWLTLAFLATTVCVCCSWVQWRSQVAPEHRSQTVPSGLSLRQWARVWYGTHHAVRRHWSIPPLGICGLTSRRGLLRVFWHANKRLLYLKRVAILTARYGKASNGFYQIGFLAISLPLNLIGTKAWCFYSIASGCTSCAAQAMITTLFKSLACPASWAAQQYIPQRLPLGSLWSDTKVRLLAMPEATLATKRGLEQAVCTSPYEYVVRLTGVQHIRRG